MHTQRVRGFTLIELLVVIAIIGILSAVVLASLNSARNKGSDAAVQSDLDAIRSQAEIYYDSSVGYNYGTNGSLESSCVAVDNMFNDSNIQGAAANAGSVNGGMINCNVSANGTAYAVIAQLLSDNTKYWCVDSVSVGRVETSAAVSGVLGTATACP